MIGARSVDLVDDELVLLDGRCRPEIQVAVDAAKARLEEARRHPDLSPQDAGFLADLQSKARELGELVFENAPMRLCGVCGADGGYATRKRGGRWHKKGSLNFARPLHLSGVEFVRSFVFIRGYPKLGCCRNCVARLLPAMREVLSPLAAQLPREITGHPPRWLRVDLKRCKKCGWSGHEREMRERPGMFGGWYFGGCPACDAENGIFGVAIETIPGFALLPVPVIEAVPA